MEITKKVYKKGKGYYYEILQDGEPFIIQDFKPDKEGFQPMTEKEAERLADKLVAKFKGANGNNEQ